MIKAITVSQCAYDTNAGELLIKKLDELQIISGYKIINIFETKVTPIPNLSDQGFVIIYDTMTDDNDLSCYDDSSGLSQEIIDAFKQAVIDPIKKWCDAHDAKLIRFGKCGFEYLPRVGDSKYIPYDYMMHIDKDDNISSE